MTAIAVGLAGSDVSRVTVERASGARTDAILVPADDAGRDLRAFVGFGPATDPITAVIAFDAEGSQLEMLELHTGPRPDRDGPMPTPAGTLLILAGDHRSAVP